MTTCVLAILAFTTIAYGQDASEENVEYEHLKVLEPLVGTWLMSGTNDEDDVDWEYKLIYSWSPSKKMLVGHGNLRWATTNDSLSEKEWEPREHRSIIWNHKKKTIEQTILHPNRGSVSVLSFTGKGNGRFAVTQESNSAAEHGTLDRMLIITGDKITINETNRKNAAGESQPDRTRTLSRLK
jgi:hypothetical protein